MLLALGALVASAQDQRPLPRGAPEVFLPASVRVHVRVHEDLDPDRLRDLSRPGVTLWLSTRTNTLKASTLENVARFDSGFVELRAPLSPVDVNVFKRAPAIGAWLTPKTLSLATRLPGVRPVAVRVEGPLTEEVAEQVRRARPTELTWAPSEPVDLLAWGQLRALPGRRVIAPRVEGLLPVKCDARTAADPSIELHVANLLALSSDVFPCGKGTRVVVQPEVEPWLVQSLVVRDPSVELVLEIGADAGRALAARKLFEVLQLGPSR